MYNYKSKKEKKRELYKYKGCKDCTKNCLWNSLVTITKESREREKFPCNLNNKEEQNA